MDYHSIQTCYGQFNHKLLGLTIDFYGKYSDNWRTFKKIYGTQKTDISKDFIHYLNSNEKDKAFQLLSVGTIIEHEIRHFHDFLLCPSWGHIIRLQTIAAFNGLQVILRIPEGTVPVPYPLWLSNKNNKTYKINEPFSQISEDMNDIFEQTVKAYDNIANRLNWSINNTLHLHSLAEASAMTSQYQSVYQTFGQEHTEFYINSVLNKNHDNYSLIYKMINSLYADKGQMVFSSIINAMVVWSLMGEYWLDKLNDHPVARIVNLLTLIKQDDIDFTQYNTRDLFSFWSEKFKLPMIDVNIKKNIDANDRLLINLHNAYNELPGEGDSGKELFKIVINNFTQYAEANKYMSNEFINNMEQYVHPDLYLENLERWVNPVMRVTFSNGGVQNNNDSSKIFKKIIRTVTHEDQELITEAILNYDIGNDMLNIETCESAFIINNFTDLFLNQYIRRDTKDIEHARQFAKNMGWSPYEIF